MGSRGLYSPAFRLRAIDDVRKIASATSFAAMSLLALAAVVGAGQAPVDEVVRLWAFATAYVAAGRIALYWSRVQARRAGEGLRPTLIIGAGKVGHVAAKRLLESPELGLKPIGFLDKDPLADAGSDGLAVLGASWDLDRIVRQYDVQQVIITFSTAPNDVLLRLVRRCQELGVAVAMVPRLYERTTTRMTVEHIGGLPLVSAHSTDPRGWQFSVKYAVDRVASLVLVLLLSPVLLAIAVGVYVSLGRPILFRQRRVGRDGVEFDMLKFRTMRPADETAAAFEPIEGSAPGGVEGVDRRTKVGKFAARDFARRAAPALQRPSRRDEPRRPPPRAARVRRAASISRCTATGSGIG